VSERDNKIADKLLERADDYENSWPERSSWLSSNSYAIATTMREIALVLRHIDE